MTGRLAGLQSGLTAQKVLLRQEARHMFGRELRPDIGAMIARAPGAAGRKRAVIDDIGVPGIARSLDIDRAAKEHDGRQMESARRMMEAAALVTDVAQIDVIATSQYILRWPRL